MGNLIKFVFLVAGLTFPGQLPAQNFGVKGGLNLSEVFTKDNDGNYSENYKMKPGYHAGLTAELPLSKFFSIETGLLISSKGTKIDRKVNLWDETEEYTGKINLLYLEVPLTAKACLSLGRTTYYCVLGPYAGIGLTGKSDTEYTYGGYTEHEVKKVDWGSDGYDEVKRLDYGLTVGAGAAVNQVQVGFTYGFGLANLSPVTENGYLIHNRVLSLSVGYVFGGK